MIMLSGSNQYLVSISIVNAYHFGIVIGILSRLSLCGDVDILCNFLSAIVFISHHIKSMAAIKSFSHHHIRLCK